MTPDALMSYLRDFEPSNAWDAPSRRGLADALAQLSTSEVRVDVIHRGVGAITEGDVLLAKASGAIVLGFHVRPDSNARAAAEREHVDVRTYRVIYEAVDDVRSALEGLLVKKAGMSDAVGLVDGLYPGAAADGFRDYPESREITPPRIAEVYTRGTLTLARLGREAPVATASPAGPALRDAAYGSAAARTLYVGERPGRSPVIGTDAPVQYEQREDIGLPRKRFRRA